MIELYVLSFPVLLAGAILALALRDPRARALAAIASQAVAAGLVLVAILPQLGGAAPIEAVLPWPAPIDDIVIHVDALGGFFLAWSLPLTLVGTIYGAGYLAGDVARGRNPGPHLALLNLVALSFVVVYSVQNALVFLIGWELAAISAWLLVIWDYQSQKIRFAGFNYLVSTHVGLFVLVAAFMLLHSKTGSMDFAAFGRFLDHKTPLRGSLFLLLGVAFALKSAFFPFHTWLPRAHAAAPAHVSALMSGVIHKAGLFGLLRFLLLIGKPEEWMGWTILIAGLGSACFGVLYTAVQRDLKRLLGYSSTENVGIVAIGIGLGCLGWTWDQPALALAGFGGALLHIVNHALFKCLLFYAAGAIYRATHTVDLERLGGLAKRMPRTAVCFLIGALALCALPPMSGFVSELLIYGGLLGGAAPSSQASALLVAIAGATGFVGAVGALAMTRAFGLAFLGTPRDPTITAAGDPPPAMQGVIVVHAGLVLALGLAPELGVALLRGALARFPVGGDAADVLAPITPLLWASRGLALALAAAGVLGWRRARAARRAATWGCGYGAPNPRMQYTASSFADGLARIFEAILPIRRRERLSPALFPARTDHLAATPVDAVEGRMFEVLGQGEELVTHASERLPEKPHLMFAAGLLALLAIGAIVAGLGGLGR